MTPLKELELTMRVRNNRLKERREMLGMSQFKLAAAAAVPGRAYCGLENLRLSPRTRGAGSWSEIALKLASFHCVEPEELFPSSVLAVETPVVRRRINGDDFLPFLTSHQQRLLEGPEVAYDQTELHEQMQRALDILSPRYVNILRMRFGFDDGIERTFADVGAELGLSPGRVRQIVERSLFDLRRKKSLGLHAWRNGGDV